MLTVAVTAIRKNGSQTAKTLSVQSQARRTYYTHSPHDNDDNAKIAMLFVSPWQNGYRAHAHVALHVLGVGA